MKAKVARKPLDALLVARELAESLEKAKAMILAGEVRVNGSAAAKAGALIPENAQIEIVSRVQKYASRGGIKLEGALADFRVDVSGKICIDIGSSTGGFTDCLLQHGAARVYAIDVNVDQLAWKLRQDSRVVPVKRNARALQRVDVGESADFAVIDVSFISAVKVLAPAVRVANARAEFLILVKPQFEVPKADVGSKGIVREAALQENAVNKVRAAAEAAGLEIIGVRPSRLPGAEGNQEFFLHARKKP